MEKPKKKLQRRSMNQLISFHRKEYIVYKAKPIKGLKIEHGGQIYDKITYMSASNEGISFEHMPNENTMVNIHCKADEAKIITGGDK